MTTTDLTTATPAEIDTALAEIYQRLYAVQDKISQHQKWIREYVKGLEQKERDGGLGPYSNWTQERLDSLREKVVDLHDDALSIKWETHPYDEEYERRGGWSRFFHVTNANGHIHRSMHCSTCFETTRYAWLTEMSGQSEEEALEGLGKAGHVLCSVCFPNAPVEYFTKREDPSVCPGSGTTDYDRETARLGYYTGNYGVCDHCGQRVTIPGRSVKMRKHKKEA